MSRYGALLLVLHAAALASFVSTASAHADTEPSARQPVAQAE